MLENDTPHEDLLDFKHPKGSPNDQKWLDLGHREAPESVQ